MLINLGRNPLLPKPGFFPLPECKPQPPTIRLPLRIRSVRAAQKIDPPFQPAPRRAAANTSRCGTARASRHGAAHTSPHITSHPLDVYGLFWVARPPHRVVRGPFTNPTAFLGVSIHWETFACSGHPCRECVVASLCSARGVFPRWVGR